MQKNYYGLMPILTFLSLIFLSINNISAQDCTNTIGGNSITAAHSSTFEWTGKTKSTVTVNLHDGERNNLGEPVVALKNEASPLTKTYTGTTVKNFSYTLQNRWNKNGGFVCGGGGGDCDPSLNNYIGRVTLEFSTPVPANEIFLEMWDVDTKKIAGEPVDGSIKFGTSEATPADFEMLTSSDPNRSAGATYDADGNITFIKAGENPDKANRYVSLIGTTTKLVSKIVMFVRNDPIDVGFAIAPVTPCPDAALSASFGTVAAQLQNNMLQVNWETLNEKNNDHFEVEVSTDGKTFNTVETVSTKATNGNSDVSIQYEQNIPLSGMAVMGVSIFLLSMGAMFRKNKWLGAVLMVVGMSAILYGCSRQDAGIQSNEKVYVRIKQVDKDGSFSYSKPVVAKVK